MIFINIYGRGHIEQHFMISYYIAPFRKCLPQSRQPDTPMAFFYLLYIKYLFVKISLPGTFEQVLIAGHFAYSQSAGRYPHLRVTDTFNASIYSYRFERWAFMKAFLRTAWWHLPIHTPAEERPRRRHWLAWYGATTAIMAISGMTYSTANIYLLL